LSSALLLDYSKGDIADLEIIDDSRVRILINANIYTFLIKDNKIITERKNKKLYLEKKAQRIKQEILRLGAGHLIKAKIREQSLKTEDKSTLEELRVLRKANEEQLNNLEIQMRLDKNRYFRKKAKLKKEGLEEKIYQLTLKIGDENLEEIRSYIRIGDKDPRFKGLSREVIHEIEAIALRVYYLAGGRLHRDYIEQGLGRGKVLILNNLTEDKDGEFKNTLSALLNLAKDEIDLLIDKETDPTLVLDVMRVCMWANKENVFVSKQLIQALKQIFAESVSEDRRNKIIGLLERQIKPGRDAVNVEILQVLSDIHFMIAETQIRQKISDLFGEIIGSQFHSVELRVKAAKIFHNQTYREFSEDERQRYITNLALSVGGTDAINQAGVIQFFMDNIDLPEFQDTFDKHQEEMLLLLDGNFLVGMMAAELLAKISKDKDQRKEYIQRLREKGQAKNTTSGKLSSVSPYIWALWRLGVNQQELRKYIEEMQSLFNKNAVNKAFMNDDEYILEIIKEFCGIAGFSGVKDVYHSTVNNILDNCVGKEGYNADVRSLILLPILEKIANEIKFEDSHWSWSNNGVDTDNPIFEEILVQAFISLLVGQAEKEGFKAEYKAVFEKFYEAVGDEGRGIINRYITAKAPLAQLAFLLDEKLLPVRFEFINDQEVSAEYLE